MDRGINLKHKKTTIIVLILVLFVVMMGVGFFETCGLGFLSKTNNYTGNGVSFKYLADYKITEVKDNSTILIAKNTKNPNLTFQVSKSPVNGDVYNGTSLDEYAKTVENDFKSHGLIVIISKDTLFLDDTDNESPMYDISYTELPSKADADSVNGRIVIFDKEGIRYTIDFQGKGKQKYDGWGSIQTTVSFTV